MCNLCSSCICRWTLSWILWSSWSRRWTMARLTNFIKMFRYDIGLPLWLWDADLWMIWHPWEVIAKGGNIDITHPPLHVLIWFLFIDRSSWQQHLSFMQVLAFVVSINFSCFVCCRPMLWFLYNTANRALASISFWLMWILLGTCFGMTLRSPYGSWIHMIERVIIFFNCDTYGRSRRVFIVKDVSLRAGNDIPVVLST